jgi:hypothetical protein
MPRPGPRRPLVGVRLGDGDIDWLDALAAELDLNRSEALRLCLAYAQQKMPRRWSPPA